MRVLIAGCGYVGLPLATKLADNHEVFGLRQEAPEGGHLREQAFNPLLGDVTDQTLLNCPNRIGW
jgi:nucleoside-diphosphate-sugar epimerase